MHKINILIPTARERRKRVQECIKAVQDNSNYPHKIVKFENSLGGWVKATLTGLKQINPNELVVVIGDDCVPQKNWLKNLVGQYQKCFPNWDGLAQPNDGTWDGLIASYPFATGEFISKWLYSGYIHNYADLELAYIARAMKKYLYVPNALVSHHNFMKDPKLLDETYLLQRKSYNHDRKLFNLRLITSKNFSQLSLIQTNNQPLPHLFFRLKYELLKTIIMPIL